MRKTEAEAEWTERKAEVGMALSELVQEYGYEPVLAGCTDFVNRETERQSKEQWLDERAETEE